MSSAELAQRVIKVTNCRMHKGSGVAGLNDRVIKDCRDAYIVMFTLKALRCLRMLTYKALRCLDIYTCLDQAC